MGRTQDTGYRIQSPPSISQDMLFLPMILLLSTTLAVDVEDSGVTNGEWSPGPCFPTCVTGPEQTSPDPSRQCVKTDCFDEQLCADMCGAIMHCHSYEWVHTNDDNDIFGETWCAVSDSGMCYCC